MTSLFSLPEGAEAAVDLMASVTRGVSLLEFFTIEDEQPEPQASARVDESSEQAARERARQTRAMVDAAREDALATARSEYELALAEGVAKERERVERICAEFARDRQRYFAAAEAQVVKLALAVARRILAREVAADPMYLAATVRAALARVQDATTTVLRVKDASGWAELLTDEAVTVVEDDRLRPEECVLETEVGRVELAIEVQLDEVERGFSALTHRQGE
jgi:flagellar assembly protein FliH